MQLITFGVNLDQFIFSLTFKIIFLLITVKKKELIHSDVKKQ